MKKIIIFLASGIIFITPLAEARSKSSSGYSTKSYSSKSYSVKKGYVQRPLYVKPSPIKPVSVKGYYNKNGKWVEPYKKTVPNRTIKDNWGTKPNINPYTGKQGTIDPNKLR